MNKACGCSFDVHVREQALKSTQYMSWNVFFVCFFLVAYKARISLTRVNVPRGIMDDFIVCLRLECQDTLAHHECKLSFDDSGRSFIHVIFTWRPAGWMYADYCSGTWNSPMSEAIRAPKLLLSVASCVGPLSRCWAECSSVRSLM